jgi:hypothetical protein
VNIDCNACHVGIDNIALVRKDASETDIKKAYRVRSDLNDMVICR